MIERNKSRAAFGIKVCLVGIFGVIFVVGSTAGKAESSDSATLTLHTISFLMFLGAYVYTFFNYGRGKGYNAIFVLFLMFLSFVGLGILIYLKDKCPNGYLESNECG